MKAMILAAGLGTRMRPLTLATPKPLLEVSGKPLIVYHIEKLAQAGICDIVINVSHLADKIIHALGDGTRYKVRLHYSREDEPLETAGGIVKALPLLGEGLFICVNGDVWSDLDFNHLLTQGRSLACSTLAHLVLVDNPQHHPAGDFHLCRDLKCSGGHARVVEQGEPKLTFSGISLLRSDLFVGHGSDVGRLARLLRTAMAEGRVTGEHDQGQWCDVGTPERLEQLNKR